jgi:hypothetical protein
VGCRVEARERVSWELRASMSLARLWRDRGKVQQAREPLAPVYGWFIEGGEGAAGGVGGVSAHSSPLVRAMSIFMVKVQH